MGAFWNYIGLKNKAEQQEQAQQQQPVDNAMQQPQQQPTQQPTVYPQPTDHNGNVLTHNGQPYSQEVLAKYYSPDNKAPNFKDLSQIASEEEAAKAAATTTPEGQTQQQTQVDTSDPINSLAGMLVTPAEREAQEQKMLKNKRRMIAWTGLFDGLRNLANLYAVSKGASPMKFTDNPYQQIDQSYQEEKQRQEGKYQNRDKYANTLYNLYRQGQQDKIKEESHKAQMEWYKNRDEMAQRKQELAEFKAKTDADYKKATLEQKNAINEVKIRLLEGQINKTEADRQYRLIMMGKQAGGGKSGGSGNTETESVEWMDDEGKKHKKVVKKKTSSGGGGSGSGNSTRTNKSGFFNK